MSKEFKISKASCLYEEEPLKTAFGFKGSALTTLWQTVVKLEAQNHSGLGLGVQSVLWSDASVYLRFGEDEGNKMMFELTKYAAKLCEGMTVKSPFEVIDKIFPKVYTYAKEITECENLRKTFVLNALVPLDFAVWQLWCKENGKTSFDDISVFDSKRHKALANIPLITYNTSLDDVRKMAESGMSLLKIKIGSDPFKDNDLESMLSWDKNRILKIHDTVKEIKTPYTKSGNILYYLDANGRYDTKERLTKLLDFAKENGILERIVLLEEPFDEQNKIDVSDLPVCIAADESAHSLEDVKERFELGYKALTLKPIAKTLSMTIRMADYARKNDMICFCADLTVNPVMVSWNQNVASRLETIPGMYTGVLESNGEQNYVNWDAMCKYHPLFTECKDGLFNLDNDFYKTNGGIFEECEHYQKLFV